MGVVSDRVRAARRAVMVRAFERFVTSWPERARRLEQLEREGPGTADTVRRTVAHAQRESRRVSLERVLGRERMIGTSWDATYFAPSERARDSARPVARLVEWGGEGYERLGVATGFMVSPSLLLTNWHVIPEAMYAQGLFANFGHERTELGVAAGSLVPLDAERFFLSNETLDFALVAVREVSQVGQVRFVDAEGKILTGDPMNIVQHPNGGPRQYAVTNNRLIHILEEEGFLQYEADTLRGSSGSPVFNTHWELVGLHHCGIPAMRGDAIVKRDGSPWDAEVDDESTIAWVANEGTRASFILAALRQARMPDATRQQLLDEVLTQAHDPLTGGALEGDVPGREWTSGEPTIRGRGDAMPFNLFQISGGTVTIHAGAVPDAESVSSDVRTETPRPSDASAVATLRAVEKSQNFDPDYTERPGYDATFLGVEVAIPDVVAEHRGDLYTIGDYHNHAARRRGVPSMTLGTAGDDEALVLPYHHYSVVLNKARRMPMVTACNVDYSDDARQDTRSRTDFGGENWRQDPRVPREYQLINSDIYGPAKNVDRGHVVRREDTAWGVPGVDTEFANADSYHYTNCTPQHTAFNKETPGSAFGKTRGIWGLFEGELEQELKAGGGQAVVFAGPVLYRDTRRVTVGEEVIICPLKFWKVIVIADSDGPAPSLLAYGFVFDQSRVVRDYGWRVEVEEALRLQAFSRQRRSLRAISALAGITFADALLAVDQHADD